MKEFDLTAPAKSFKPIKNRFYSESAELLPENYDKIFMHRFGETIQRKFGYLEHTYELLAELTIEEYNYSVKKYKVKEKDFGRGLFHCFGSCIGVKNPKTRLFQYISPITYEIVITQEQLDFEFIRRFAKEERYHSNTFYKQKMQEIKEREKKNSDDVFEESIVFNKRR